MFSIKNPIYFRLESRVRFGLCNVKGKFERQKIKKTQKNHFPNAHNSQMTIRFDSKDENKFSFLLLI